MKNALWTVNVMVAGFIGFLIGYSLSPMIEVGLIGGKPEEAGINTEMTEDMQEYYSKLRGED